MRIRSACAATPAGPRDTGQLPKIKSGRDIHSYAVRGIAASRSREGVASCVAQFLRPSIATRGVQRHFGKGQPSREIIVNVFVLVEHRFTAHLPADALDGYRATAAPHSLPRRSQASWFRAARHCGLRTEDANCNGSLLRRCVPASGRRVAHSERTTPVRQPAARHGEWLCCLRCTAVKHPFRQFPQPGTVNATEEPRRRGSAIDRVTRQVEGAELAKGLKVRCGTFRRRALAKRMSNKN